jgi:mRNA interferase HigB
MTVRIIKPSTVRGFESRHPDAAPGLDRWLGIAEAAVWRSLHDVRQAFRSADSVKVASGRTVVVFNIHGNDYRLITAIHYNRSTVFILRFITHAQYSQGRWKEDL